MVDWEQRTHELEKLNAELKHATALKMFDSVIGTAQDALKSLVLINGGAAVSLLAFIGGLVKDDHFAYPLESIARALLIFTIGAGLSVMSTCLRYASQHCFSWAMKWSLSRPKQAFFALGFGHAHFLFSFLGGYASLACFFWGGVQAYSAVSSWFNIYNIDLTPPLWSSQNQTGFWELPEELHHRAK